jgi:hypothetical protein
MSTQSQHTGGYLRRKEIQLTDERQQEQEQEQEQYIMTRTRPRRLEGARLQRLERARAR